MNTEPEKRNSIFSHLSDPEFEALYKAKSRQIFGAKLRAEEAIYRAAFPEIRKQIESEKFNKSFIDKGENGDWVIESLKNSNTERVGFWKNPETGKIEMDNRNSILQPRFKPNE